MFPDTAPTRTIRDHFIQALRVLSVADAGRARVARQMENEVNDVLMAIERYASAQSAAAPRAAVDSAVADGQAARTIADQWLGLSRAALSLGADLADLLLVLARHWLLQQVPPSRAADWMRLAGVAVRLFVQRENHPGSGDAGGSSDDAAAALASLTVPTLFLTLCGFPRGVSPAEAEVALHDGDVIGRSPEATWTLPGEAVSRAHVRIAYDAAKRSFRAIDLSRNGIGLDRGRGLDGGAGDELVPGMLLKIPRRGDYQVLVRSVFIPAAVSAIVRAEDSGRAATHEDGSMAALAGSTLLDVPPARLAAAGGAGEANAAPDRAAAGPRQRAGLVSLIRDYVTHRADCSALVEALFAQVLE
jgi:hypothetical protein